MTRHSLQRAASHPAVTTTSREACVSMRLFKPWALSDPMSLGSVGRQHSAQVSKLKKKMKKKSNISQNDTVTETQARLDTMLQVMNTTRFEKRQTQHANTHTRNIKKNSSFRFVG